MAAYKDTEELNKVLLALWEAIKVDKQMAAALVGSKIIISFHYREPESRLTVDCSDGQTLKVYVGEPNVKPQIEMFMKSDLAHDFWLGKVNVPLALLAGKIVSQGPIHKALALLPVIKPAYNLYPSIYETHSFRAL